VQRPIYADLLPPCNNACPAGENIRPGSNRPAGKYRAPGDAVRDNPMPQWHAGVYHPCEGACNRGELDAPVASTPSSVFLATCGAEGWTFRWRRRRAANGFWYRRRTERLSAGYHLARLGHAVEIHEADRCRAG